MAVQELKTNDHEKRLHYCRWLNQFIKENTADVLDVTFFTDKAWFYLPGYVSLQNSRLWSSDNPYSLHETPYMIRRLVCGLQFPDIELLALFSL